MSSRLERRLQKRSERDEKIHQQREHFKRRERNKKIFNYAILAVVLIAVAYAGFALFKPEGPGEYDGFAQCLTANGAVMYGTDWCPHCQEQKRLFGSSFRYVTYVNCDYNKPACDAAGVEGYPTWVVGGRSFAGTQQLATLAQSSECTLGT